MEPAQRGWLVVKLMLEVRLQPFGYAHWMNLLGYPEPDTNLNFLNPGICWISRGRRCSRPSKLCVFRDQVRHGVSRATVVCRGGGSRDLRTGRGGRQGMRRVFLSRCASDWIVVVWKYHCGFDGVD